MAFPWKSASQPKTWAFLHSQTQLTPDADFFIIKKFVTALSDILPLFKNLQDITLTRLVDIYGPATLADLDTEFETVVHWGRLCPNLLMCTLPCEYTVLSTSPSWCEYSLTPLSWYHMVSHQSLRMVSAWQPSTTRQMARWSAPRRKISRRRRTDKNVGAQQTSPRCFAFYHRLSIFFG